MATRTAVMDEWVTQVLGYRFAASGGAAAAARLQAGRPREAPKAAMTDNLLATMSRAAPGTAEELPAILSGMIPRFLLAIQNEPHMDARPMAQGASLPAQDQVLAVADSLNAVLRSARRWEALLDEAEQGDGLIDKAEAAKRDKAQHERYEDLVASYNATRSAALAEQARCVQLVAKLSAEFQAAQDAAPR